MRRTGGWIGVVGVVAAALVAASAAAVVWPRDGERTDASAALPGGPWPVLVGAPSGWRLADVSEPDDDSREWGVSYQRAVEDGTLGLSVEVVEATHVMPWHREVRGERLGSASVDGQDARVWRSDLGGRPNGFHALTRVEDVRYVSIGAYPARDEDFAAEEWEELLASVRLVSRAEAETRMPSAMVLPREERDFVRRALAKMPLPDGRHMKQVWRRLDPGEDGGLNDYQFEDDAAYNVATIVVCGWVGYRHGTPDQAAEGLRALKARTAWPAYNDQAATAVKQWGRRTIGMCN